MSLINDALKRAKESQQQQSQMPPGAPPLPPVEPESSGGLGWFLPVLIILLVVIAGLFVALAFFTQKSLAPQTVVPVTNVVQVAAAPPPVLPKTNPVVAVAQPPAPPELKLQGIFFNAASPQAIVNGHTVNVGDTVDGFRVTLISKDNVSLIAPDGTEKTLALSE